MANQFNRSYLTPLIAVPTVSLAQLQSGGLAGVIGQTIAANSTAIAPVLSAPTVSATGGGTTGGSLPAGTYYLQFTETNGIGETLPSPESASFTVAAGNVPQVTLPAIASGLNGINIYLTQAGGASGSETLYATGVTTATYNLSSALYAGLATPPTSNTTALSGQILRECVNLQNLAQTRSLPKLANLYAGFTRGNPIAFDEICADLIARTVAFKVLLVSIEAANATVWANSGTLKVVTGVNGYSEYGRFYV